MQPTENGVYRYRAPSWWQWLLILCIWALMAAFFIILIRVVQDEGPRTIVAIALVIVTMGITIFLMSRGKGKEQAIIVGVDGLRGEFVIRNYVRYALLVPLTMISGVFLILLNEDAPLRPEGQIIVAIVGIIMILCYIFLLWPRPFSRFRIDHDGTLWILRRGTWEELRIDDYRKITAKVTSGRYGKSLSSLVFSDHIEGRGKLRFPLMQIFSKEYGTPVGPTLIGDYVRSRCKQLNYTVTLRGRNADDGWEATKEM